MALDYLSLRSSASATASARVISCSTLTGSSLIGSSLGSFPTSLTVSSLTGSTVLLNRVTTSALDLSTLTGSTVTLNNVTTTNAGLSTLTGSTMTLNTATMDSLGFSTLTGSSVSVTSAMSGALGFSTLAGSTATLNTITTRSIGLSTLTGSTVTLNNVTTSVMDVSTLTVSTLIGGNLPSGSVNTSTLMASTLTAVNLITSTLSVTSTMLTLGPNTQSTMVNASQGSYVAGSWQIGKTGLTNAKKLAMSATGQYQIVVSRITSDLWLSSDSGVNWTALGASQGLPVLTGSAQWMTGAISASGQRIVLAMYGGSLWFSSDFGRTFATSSQATPNIWLQLNGDVTDTMGGPAATATGSPAYVNVLQPGFTEQAVNLANTAGGTATRYVRGTWAGASNFTVSMWVNFQTIGTQQNFFSSYSSTGFVLYLNNNNLRVFLSGGDVAVTSFTVSLNTWYYVYATFVANGTGAFYVNGNLINTYFCGATPGTSSGLFSLGTNDTGTGAAFNGYITDFRLYNSAVTYVPIAHLSPNIWLPFEGSTADSGSNAITPTVTGSISYVPGVVGQMALNLDNTAGGTATKYIRGSWTGAANFTISCWFNLQSLGAIQTIFSAYGTVLYAYVNASNQVVCTVPNGGAGSSSIVGTSSAISHNTWYYLTLIFQSNGLCSFYLNHTLIASITNSGGVGALTTTNITLGTYDNGTGQALNGYIDDFRLYNSALPYSSLLSQNYTHLAMSGNGTYQMAGNAVGQLWLSSTSGSSWTLSSNAVTPGAWTSLSASYSGKHLVAQSQPIVRPNQAGLTTNVWTEQGIRWIATASDLYWEFGTRDGNGAFWLFDKATSGWASNSVSASTITVQDIGSITGVWFQLQASVPLIMYSYSITNSLAAPDKMMRRYYILGSNNGTTWYPVHYSNFSTNPFTVLGTKLNNDILVNYTGTQTVFGNVSATTVTTSYSYSTIPYLIFRVFITTSWGGGLIDMPEFTPNFITSHGSIVPNQAGLTTTTWSLSGVSWITSASSSLANYEIYKLFNNQNAVNGWANGSLTYNAAGTYTGAISTSIQGIGAVLGEWAQLQGSIPLVLQSYTYTAGGLATQAPKTYYICGSNDNSTWYPLQYVSMTTTPFTAAVQACTTNMIMNYTGTQTIQGGQSGSGTTTSYAPYVTMAWTYFRMITTNTYGTGAAGYVELNEFRPFFSVGQNSSTDYGLTWSPTLQTGDAFNVRKNITVTSAGTGFVTLPDFRPVTTGFTISTWFTLPSTPVQWGRLFVANTASPQGLGTPFIYMAFNAGKLSITQYNNANAPNFETTTTFVASTLYHVVWTVDGSGNHRAYVNGTQDGTGSGAIVATTYPFVYIGKGTFDSDPYLNITVHDFRMFNRGLNAAEVLALYANRNYGQPALESLALSESGEYALGAHQTVASVSSSYLSRHQLSTYTNPLLSGINAPIIDTAVSQTGQYMVLVTTSATNNVYYSRDYGATFTGLTIGSTPMVSCSISHDGSYLIVTNATTTYRLNSNSTGYSVAVGSQAGQINQALNAIAIGNQAGQVNQSANSIVLNATGSAVNTGSAGFYVAPLSGPSGLDMELLGYGTDSQVMKTGVIVAPGGNIGIGTTSPLVSLHIYNTTASAINPPDHSTSSGHLLLMNGKTGSSPYAMAIGIDQNHGFGYLNAAGNNTLQPICLNTRGGNVGIGTTNPAYLLSVNGHFQVINNTNDVMGLFSPSYGNYLHIGSWNAQGSVSKTLVLQQMGGNVGIGITNPSYRLHVVGDIYATANVIAMSDQRVKHDVKPIVGALDRLSGIHGYTYLRDGSDDRQMGLIAQEVKEAYPEAVHYDNQQDRYGVNYNAMIAPLLEAIKELKAKVEELSMKVAA